VFIGIEGANVFSARAAERANVGRATVIGFVITLLLLIAVSLLSLGVLKQPELAALKNPRWPVYFRSPPGRGARC
jgi:arginine:ornithine antiporter/lysine permease